MVGDTGMWIPGSSPAGYHFLIRRWILALFLAYEYPVRINRENYGQDQRRQLGAPVPKSLRLVCVNTRV